MKTVTEENLDPAPLAGKDLPEPTYAHGQPTADAEVVAAVERILQQIYVNKRPASA